MAHPLFVTLLAFPLVVFVCLPSFGGGKVLAAALSQDDERKEYGRTAVEEKEGDEEVFQQLNSKMDEYQNLLALCEHLSDSMDGKGIMAACEQRLPMLRQDILKLSDRLQEQQTSPNHRP
jgi:hypothetical protein